jgi:hypothetical protein
MNLEVVKFLLEHGADKNLKSKSADHLNCYELTEKHCAREEVRKLLTETK